MIYRVWYVRNVPGKPQHFYMDSIEKAKAKIRELTEQDLEDDSVESNAMGLEVFEDNEWTEYYDEQGRDIMEIMKEEEKIIDEEEMKMAIIEDLETRLPYGEDQKKLKALKKGGK